MNSSIIILCLLGDPVLPAVSYDRTGGFNVDMQEILHYWSSFPYSITVITNSSSYITQTNEKIYENIHIHRIPLDDSIMNNQPQLAKEFPRILQETIAFIDTSMIQPLFFHSYYWYSGLLALELSRKYRVKFLHSVIALSIDKKITNSPNFCPIQYDFERAFFPYASHILAISNAEKQTLIKHYTCREENIIVTGRSVHNAFLFPDHDSNGIPNSLIQDNEQKWKMYIKGQPLNSWWSNGAFTYIGRIKYEKGIGNIIEAWYQLYLNYKDSMPPLWIIGGQPDTIIPLRKDFVKRYPEFLNLEKEMKVCWWGYLSPASINAVLLKTSVVVTHSQYEAGGRVIIEALSAGKPVIATPTGFAADLVKDWKNGFIVPFGDISLLAKRMEHFIRQPLISNPLGEYARYTFQNAVDNWHYYEKHRAIYDYHYNQYQYEPIICKEEIDIFENIPDFYRKKLLYSWPDQNDIKERIEIWVKKMWNDTSLKLIYCMDLSHHSFIWKFQIGKKVYYIKHLYTTFNDLMIWNDYSFRHEIYQASHSYEIATNLYEAITINEKDKNLSFYITEEAHNISSAYCLRDYQDILQKIYLFDIQNSINELPCNIDTYTYEQLLGFTIDNNIHYNELTEELQEVLNLSDIPQELSISYGKEFFSHIMHTENGYKLLPSSSVCKAPLGLDAAIFLIELSKELGNNLTPQNFYMLLLSASKIFDVSTLVLYCLCLLIHLLAIKKQHILSNEQHICLNYTFWEKLLHLL